LAVAAYRHVASNPSTRGADLMPRKSAMLRNSEIAQKFEAIADMLAMESENPFRIRAYQNAARTLRGHDVEVADMIRRGEDLSQLRGIGKDLAEKIRELAETGETQIHEELRRKTPPLAFKLLQLPGLGPKRVHALCDALQIDTIAQLRRAAQAKRVRTVKGFGPKGEERLLRALEKAEKPVRRLLASARGDAEALEAYMRAAPGVVDVVVAGSFRRGRESVGDLDLVVAAKSGRTVIEHLMRYPGAAETSAAGSTRATLRLKTGLQVDVRAVRPESFGAAVLYFTGSKPHVVAVRAIVRKRGWKLNEYGLYRGGRKIAGASEEEVYRALGLDFIPPELREARGEIEAARAHALPRLVEAGDLEGDLHVRHDGDPIAPIINAAKERRLRYLAFVSRLDRLGRASLADRTAAIDRARRLAAPVQLFHALDVDIASDGALTAPEPALSGVDFVFAGVGADFDLPRARQTERLLAALADPHVAVLAHPTCRLVNTREPIDADWPRIVRAAADNGVALELTGDPERLDLTDLHCRMARDAGALVAIGSEARAPQDLDRLGLAVTQARRGWLEAGSIVNASSAAELTKRLRGWRKKARSR
jgi:DNA polymerase (family 10)